MAKVLKSESLKQQAHLRIVETIMNGELAPGQVIVERDLAERLQMSRAPVREALVELEQKALIRRIGSRTRTVAEPTMQDVVEIYEMREMFEGMAARLLAPHISDDLLKGLKQLAQRLDGPDGPDEDEARFHNRMIRECGNTRLSRPAGSVHMQLVIAHVRELLIRRGQQMKTKQIVDASGRGSIGDFKVPFPGRMHGYSEQAIEAVVEVMRNAECQTQGKYMQQFEEDFKAYTGANHAFATNSASSALRLAAILCRLKAGDEVIIPAYTFCATAVPFGMTGAKIVWSDIDRDTWVVDPADIERKITDKTKALVVTHLLGMPANMPAIMSIAKEHDLRVVEDCAQAPGSAIDGQKVGTFGDVGCFSFQGAKSITTLGEGGFLTVRSGKDAKLVPGLRHNGCRGFEGNRQRYWDPAMGNVDLDIEGVWPHKFCLGEAQCAAGIAELKTLEKVNETLVSQARRIIERLVDTPEITFAKVPEGYRHIYHQCVLHFDGSAFGTDRNDLMDILVNEYRIRCIVQYYPLYRYPLFQKMGFGQQDCPVLERWWDNSFSFPWYCNMTDETIEYLVNSTKAAIKKLKQASSIR